MFKNRSMQVKFIKDEDLKFVPTANVDGNEKPRSYEYTAQAIVLGRHLTLGVMAIVATYVACDTARQIAVNYLSK